MFSVEFDCPEVEHGFRLEVEVPKELMDLIREGKIRYNLNCPGDPSDLNNLFIDDEYLFINIDDAVKSGRFFINEECTETLTKDNISDEIWAYEDMGFTDPLNYFDNVDERKNGNFKLTFEAY